MGGHKIDFVWSNYLSCGYKIPFILSIFVVNNYDDFSSFDGCDGFLDTIQ
jgi:hypothetical protein